MTATKLKPIADTKPDIKIIKIKTAHKPVKALYNRICGIGLILLGMLSMVIQNGTGTPDGTAAIMLFLMGLAAFIGNN